MKQSAEHAERFRQLLAELRAQDGRPEQAGPEEPLHQLLYAFLLWGTGRRQADRAYGRLMEGVVDVNELRVTDPREVVELIGRRYPRALERAQRLTRVLHGIYLKEHRVSLWRLAEMSKREARTYLEELDGMVPFVTASVCLVSLQAHALPVDELLGERLRQEGVVPESASLAEVQSFLEHHVLAEEARQVFLLLRSHCEPAAPAGAKRSGHGRAAARADAAEEQ